MSPFYKQFQIKTLVSTFFLLEKQYIFHHQHYLESFLSLLLHRQLISSSYLLTKLLRYINYEEIRLRNRLTKIALTS